MNGPQARSIIPVAVHRAHFVAGTLRRASGIPAIAAEAAIRPAAPLPARARRSQLVPCPVPSYKQSHESTRAGASRSSEARAYPIRAAPSAVHLASPADSTPRSSTAIAHCGIFVSQPGWRTCRCPGPAQNRQHNRQVQSRQGALPGSRRGRHLSSHQAARNPQRDLS